MVLAYFIEPRLNAMTNDKMTNRKWSHSNSSDLSVRSVDDCFPWIKLAWRNITSGLNYKKLELKFENDDIMLFSTAFWGALATRGANDTKWNLQLSKWYTRRSQVFEPFG